MKDNYNPYCSKCGGCGEDGCCPASMCTQDGGDYCEYYLKELKFGYVMHKFFYNNLFNSLTKEQQDIYDKEWNKQYDIIFDKEKVSPQDPAVCEYSGLRPVEGYKEEIEDKIKYIDKKIEEIEDRRDRREKTKDYIKH